MRSSLFGQHREVESEDSFVLQNERMLKVRLNGEVMARQGAMVAYQGQVDFNYQGSGSVAKFLKKAVTGEGVPLMRCSGQGDLFLAKDADEVFVVTLEDESIVVSGQNILAFESSLTWDIKRVEGASMFAGGLFNTVLSGSGSLAIVCHGSPVVLDTNTPTFVDVQSAVAWSGGINTKVNVSVKAGAMIGRGSGEAAQIAYGPGGFVIVQASEGVPPVPQS
jgi:uncharacterized protein (AIM24 family)